MNITVNEAIAQATAQKRKKITLEQIGQALNVSKQYIGQIKEKPLNNEQLKKIEDYLQVNFTEVNNDNIDDCIPITYLPEIYLSAGFGIENYYENQEKMMIDAALLISERGIRINPKYCKIVRISGNSMSPEYRHGDRVIIDENDKELSDGQIFAFRYDGKCYVKEINLMGKRIKCISLNKDYDPFYIKEDEEITVLGRILPRIRL